MICLSCTPTCPVGVISRARLTGRLSVAAGPSYAQALPDPIAPVAALPRVASALPAEEVQVGDVSVSFAAPVPAVDGYRLAWCRSFDAATGEVLETEIDD